MNLTVLGLMMALLSSVSLAKGGDEVAQIVILNDSAAALEESNPKLAKSLTEFADQKEKELEDIKSGNQEQIDLSEQDIKKRHEDHIKLLNSSAAALQPTYPEIAKGLSKMADDITKMIEKKISNDKQ